VAHREVQPVPAARLTPRAAWAGAAAAVTGVVIALAMPQALVGVFYDDGIYAALARSLAEGGGYRLHYLPGSPAAVHYPFGYPVFLAALWKLWPSFPDNVVLLRGANAVLMALFAGLATLYLTRRDARRPWLVAGAIALTCISVPMVAVATVLFSEPLFLALAVLACWIGDAARDRDGRRGLVLAALAGLLAGLAALTRSIGVAVIVGVAASLFLGRRRAAAGLAAGVAALVLLPWLLWTSAHQAGVDRAVAANYGTYFDLLAQSGASWIGPGSLLAFARPLAAIALPAGPGWLVAALALPALVALAVGARALLDRAPAAGWMLLAYLAIVAVWPYAPDRFLWAALPWLACAFTLGVAGLVARAAAARWYRVAGWTAAAVVALGFLPRQATGLARGAATATQRGISATFEELLPWIRAATDPSAIVAGEDEALLWLYTGRRAVPSFVWRVRGREAASLGPDTLRAFLLRTGATHLVLTGPGSEAAPTINDLLGRYPGFLEVVRSWPRPMLAFRIRRSDTVPAVPVAQGRTGR
jgi:hypothetical protein